MRARHILSSHNKQFLICIETHLSLHNTFLKSVSRHILSSYFFFLCVHNWYIVRFLKSHLKSGKSISRTKSDLDVYSLSIVFILNS